MRFRFRSLIGSAAVVVIIVVGTEVYKAIRSAVLHRTDATGLRHWWEALIGAFFLLFLISAVSLVAMFKRVLDLHSLIVLVVDTFLAWVLFSLATIMSDPAALPALTSIGLSSLNIWLFILASIWVLFVLYVLFRKVDKHLSLSKRS
jgi:hypothetical protein